MRLKPYQAHGEAGIISDLQPYIKDIRWLFVQCKQAGIEPPKGEHCEAFAERVAILLADGGMTEAEARAFAFTGHLEQRQRLAGQAD